jgi:hypothetical protein
LHEYEQKWAAFVEWMERERPTMAALRDVDKDTAKAYMENLNHGRLASPRFRPCWQTRCWPN